MTIDEVLQPVMLPVACGFAIFSVFFFFWHVARRMPGAPKKVPLSLRFDGRPGRVGSKRWLWLPPAVIAAVTAFLAFVLPRTPGAADERTAIALVFLTIAEVAWFGAWQTDRQIELARKMTYRIPPLRTLRVFFPILVTIVVTIIVAIHP